MRLAMQFLTELWTARKQVWPPLIWIVVAMMFSLQKQSTIIYHVCYAKGLSKNLLLTPLIQSCSKKIFIQNQIKTETGIYGNIERERGREREREGERKGERKTCKEILNS